MPWSTQTGHIFAGEPITPNSCIAGCRQCNHRSEPGSHALCYNQKLNDDHLFIIILLYIHRGNYSVVRSRKNRTVRV